MKIVLIGGGSGGHITPLLAVARELKQQDPNIELIGVCEAGSAFVDLYRDCPDIDEVAQISAGKYRRYGGQSLLKKITDVETWVLNSRDVFRMAKGYRQAKKLLKAVRPDAMLVKGGFVAVPMGLAAAKLNIPFVTHDSDSTPGLANKIISKWAKIHATGMPADLYAYPKEKTVYTGIPVSLDFTKVDGQKQQSYRKQLGLEDCQQVITVVGGSQGGEQLNIDMVSVVARLMATYDSLGIIHVAGKAHEGSVRAAYGAVLSSEQLECIKVSGFVTDIAMRQGAASIVVSRAGATQTAELALQSLPVVFVPGRLAGSHQDKNATFFAEHKAALVAPFGDTEQLYSHIETLLMDSGHAAELAKNLAGFAKPDAANELANTVLGLVRNR